MNPFTIITSIGGSVLVTAIVALWLDNTGLERQIAILEDSEEALIKELVLENVNYTTCMGTLTHQNTELEKMRTQADTFVPATPEEVVFSHLPTDSNNTGECHGMEDISDFIRHNIID